MIESTRHAPLDWVGELPCRVGEILVERDAAGSIRLCHRDDVQRADLEAHTAPETASELARYDDAEVYRPLKTAPNLRRGWLLVLPTIEEVRLALELFYPGRAAAFAAWKKGKLRTTPFRETLARQSGMYRVAARISEDEADRLIAGFCRSDGGCLRTILWNRDLAGTPASTGLPREKFDPSFDQTGRGERAPPLLCQEACNLLVARIRREVKERMRDEG